MKFEKKTDYELQKHLIGNMHAINAYTRAVKGSPAQMKVDIYGRIEKLSVENNKIRAILKERGE